MIEPLHTVTLTELYDTVYPPKVQVIDGLLSSGVYLFAGAPKIGKSFFMAQLGYHVSNGLHLWGYTVHRGTVLYLALEDDFARIQKRLSRMFGEESSGCLHFATCSQNLNGGLEYQLEQFIKENPLTLLVIIDTLQKIRESNGDSFSYANDYDAVSRLKQFADRHNICIMLVHHTRKQYADDRFDTISGTNGLLGAADGAFIMAKEKRTEDKAVLDVAGRDHPDQRLCLLFDRERCVWQLTRTDTKPWKESPDPIVEAVAQFMTLRRTEWSGTSTELSNALGLKEMQPNVLARRLNVRVDVLWNNHGIRYENSRSHTGRFITLKPVQVKA